LELAGYAVTDAIGMKAGVEHAFTDDTNLFAEAWAGRARTNGQWETDLGFVGGFRWNW